MGMTVSTGRSNDEMVDNLIEANSLTSKNIELAYRLVDRGRFMPNSTNGKSAYDDTAFRAHPTDPGYIHLSAPGIYAIILENFDLRRGLSFLNIGSGTGYFNTIVGFIIGENAINHGIELFENILEFAENAVAHTLKMAETSAYGWCVPEFFYGNAFQLKMERRYDRIYCGAKVPPSRRSFFCNLLSVNGVLIMPYGDNLQRIVRRSESSFSIQNISSVQFANFEQPNPNNEFSMRPITIGLPTPPRLEEICRRSIRAYIRSNLIGDGFRLNMRYKCAEEKSSAAAPDNSGRDHSDTDISSVPCPFTAADRGETSHERRANGSHSEETNASSSVAQPTATISASRTIPRRRLFIGRAAHRERVEHLLGILDDRVVRHRNAQARNATRAVARDTRRSLLELQRDRERRENNDQQLLDDADFELIKGFSFEGIDGVDDELAGMEDDENIADMQRIHRLWNPELPPHNEDGDLASNHDNTSGSSTTSDSSNHSGDNGSDDEDRNGTHESFGTSAVVSSSSSPSLRRSHSRRRNHHRRSVEDRAGPSHAVNSNINSSVNERSSFISRLRFTEYDQTNNRNDRNTIHLHIRGRRPPTTPGDDNDSNSRLRPPTPPLAPNNADATICRNVGGGSLVIRFFANDNTQAGPPQNHLLRRTPNSSSVIASNSNANNANEVKPSAKVKVESNPSVVQNHCEFTEDLCGKGTASTSGLSLEFPMNANLRNGKRLGTPSNHLVKRSRSDMDGVEGETLEQKEIDFASPLAENGRGDDKGKTAKILEDGIGHALDEYIEEDEQENNVLVTGMVGDLGNDVSDSDKKKDDKSDDKKSRNEDTEKFENEVEMNDSGQISSTSLNENDTGLREESSCDASSNIARLQRSFRNLRRGRQRAYRSEVPAHDDETSMDGEANVCSRVVGRTPFSSMLALREAARNAQRDDGAQDSKEDAKPSDVDDDDDMGTDSELHEREEAVQRQAASLEAFQREFAKRLQTLPIASRMCAFLMYE